jgi:acetyltransferase-like isoleucine patch superfamily enzyme
MPSALFDALGRRTRGALAKVALATTFPLRRSRVAWSTSVLLDAGAALRLGQRAVVGGHGSIVVGPGGSFSLGDHSGVMQGCEIAVGEQATVTIGDDVYVGAHVNIRSSGRITVGHNARLAQFVSLVGGQYRYQDRHRLIREQGFEPADVNVGEDAWLGVGVVVLSGVTIGQGAVVGAGAIVTRDVAPYAIAVGNPARVVGERGKQEGRGL